MNGAAKRIAIALALTIAAAACAETKTSETMSPHVDDAAITSQVEAALLQDSALKATQIEVQTKKSIVQLSGFVDTPALIVRAGELARQASGVSAVQNNLMVK